MGRKEHLPIIIFSVFRSETQDEHNNDVHNVILQTLTDKGVSFKELSGVYNGVNEKSILVAATHENLVKEICAHFKQDCYLYSGVERDSYLVYPDSRKEFIGVLQRVNNVSGLDAYTYDKSDDSYWACK